MEEKSVHVESVLGNLLWLRNAWLNHGPELSFFFSQLEISNPDFPRNLGLGRTGSAAFPAGAGSCVSPVYWLQGSLFPCCCTSRIGRG